VASVSVLGKHVIKIVKLSKLRRMIGACNLRSMVYVTSIKSLKGRENPSGDLRWIGR
jgi:hypothetical protein